MLTSPHSLGTLFEWKQFLGNVYTFLLKFVPTRWGHYLNGNRVVNPLAMSASSGPHSLGTLFEWKLLVIRNCR